MSELYGPFTVHPLIELFPATSDEDYDFLVASVRESGVLRPILTDHEGRVILHGRARVRATIAAGRNPRYIPRIMLQASIRHEGVLDLLLDRALADLRMDGSRFLKITLAAQPMYLEARFRRERFGVPRVMPQPGTRHASNVRRLVHHAVPPDLLDLGLLRAQTGVAT